MANCVKQLINCSYRIELIDPYFRPRPEHFRPLIALMGQAKNRVGTTFIYHTSEKIKCEVDYLESECKEKLRNSIPNNIKVIVKYWQEKENNKPLHDRFIVTEKGGYSFGHGLDEGPKGETVNITLLGKDRLKEIHNDFRLLSGKHESDSYILLDEFEVS